MACSLAWDRVKVTHLESRKATDAVEWLAWISSMDVALGRGWMMWVCLVGAKEEERRRRRERWMIWLKGWMDGERGREERGM